MKNEPYRDTARRAVEKLAADVKACAKHEQQGPRTCQDAWIVNRLEEVIATIRNGSSGKPAGATDHEERLACAIGVIRLLVRVSGFNRHDAYVILKTSAEVLFRPPPPQ